VKGIADTGFLVAFANRDDAHHPWAVRLATDVKHEEAGLKDFVHRQIGGSKLT
jgi:predicted nucleic acid-binding protein